MNRLQNKTALITGGARGIGKATAELFIKEGAKVYITDVLDDEGQDVARNIGATYVHLDVSCERDWANAIDATKQYLDILVNNAGVLGAEGFGPQDPENATLESWRRIHSINLDGVFLGCKYAIAAMKNKGGSIINMSSRSAMVGVPGAAAYASSKAAVRNHTKTVALYCAQKSYDIRCNSVHPAAILTKMWDPVLGEDQSIREKKIKEICTGIPLGKMGEPIDVAYAILYFASDESKFVTGSELVIDGGILAGSSSAPEKSS